MANGNSSHAEGYYTNADGKYAHSEGYYAKAIGDYSHAEGVYTTVSGGSAHVGGEYNIPDDINIPAWVSRTSYEVGDRVKLTKGYYECITANSDRTFTGSKWKMLNRLDYAEIIGNGTADSARSNARTLDWNGNSWYAGNVTAAGGSLTLGSGSNEVTITAEQLR